MELRYNLHPTMGDLAGQIDQLRERALSTDVRFDEHPIVKDIADSLELKTAICRRQYETGVSALEERYKFELAQAALSDLNGLRAKNYIVNNYDNYESDLDLVDDAVSFFVESEVRVNEIEYQLGWDDSRFERFMYDIAQKDVMHFVAPRAVSAVVGAGLGIAVSSAIRNGGDYVSLTSLKTGAILGFISPAVAWQLRSLPRALSRYVGGLFRALSTGSLSKYHRPKDDNEEDREQLLKREFEARYYATRDAAQQEKEMHSFFVKNKIRTREDVGRVVGNAALYHANIALKEHGITQNRSVKASWYRKWPSKITGIDFLS